MVERDHAGAEAVLRSTAHAVPSRCLLARVGGFEDGEKVEKYTLPGLRKVISRFPVMMLTTMFCGLCDDMLALRSMRSEAAFSVFNTMRCSPAAVRCMMGPVVRCQQPPPLLRLRKPRRCELTIFLLERSKVEPSVTKEFPDVAQKWDPSGSRREVLPRSATVADKSDCG